MRDRSAAGECAVDESADHGGEGFGVFDGEVVVVAEHQRYSYRAYPTAAQTLMLAGEHQRLRSGRVRAVAVALVFRDDNHLTVEHAEALSPVVGALVDRALPSG
ncbi:hypothetical protein GS563_28910 [Rhodococcus hoagii]|nr:hypothetical protein [Prescottella equi]MBM4532703.1 hypothetical protein [Prescottella equi]